MHNSNKNQSGAVLVISLIMLMLLTLIGISGTQNSALEEKMASNQRDKDLAFQAAESALSAAEASIDTLGPTFSDFSDAGTGGFYTEASTIPTPQAILTDAFWNNSPVGVSSVSTLGNDLATPNYIIQQVTIPAPPGGLASQGYRITVRATGRSSDTVVILQSIYVPLPPAGP